MSIFSSEQAMQDWLAEKLEGETDFADLIFNNEYLDEKLEGHDKHTVLSSYQRTFSALFFNRVLSDDKNFSANVKEKLRPDFIMSASEAEGLVVVELKNIAGPTRQAGTELSAYREELRSQLLSISDGDLYNVIISVEWPTLLTHFIREQILFYKLNYICLQPVLVKDQIKLEILKVEKLLDVPSTRTFSDHETAGFQLCLYDHDVQMGKAPGRLEWHIDQMEAALMLMANEGRLLRSDGFAFLWADNSSELAPYSITLINAAPFELAKRNYQGRTAFEENLRAVIFEHELSGYGNSIWRIHDAGTLVLNSFCSPFAEGMLTWSHLERFMLQRGTLFSFKGWGVFGDIFNERLTEKYRKGEYDIYRNCPWLGLEVVSEVISKPMKYD